MSERTTYARYIVPDVIVDNEYAREVADRDPQQAADAAPAGAIAFEFYDIVTSTVPVGGEPVPVSSKPLHLSGRFWIDGEAFDAEQVEALPGDHKVLLANMRGNGWAKVVRCRHGGMRPFADGDQIVKTRTVAQ